MQTVYQCAGSLLLTVFGLFATSSKGRIVAQGTYKELQSSGLDVGFLLKSQEEQDRPYLAANSDKESICSKRTNHSNSSVYSHGPLLPPECNGPDLLPVSSGT